MTDTNDEARQRQVQSYSAMPGADKVMLAAQMAEQAKAIAIDGIRSRRPELGEAEVHAAWLKLLHGDLTPRLTRS